MSDYLTFIQLKAKGADNVKWLLLQNEIETQEMNLWNCLQDCEVRMSI